MRRLISGISRSLILENLKAVRSSICAAVSFMGKSEALILS
ncbi:hypothetical protein [Scytonema sp. NUACC26]